VGIVRRGIIADVNVVRPIDILPVLLVILMIIPHRQMGLQASLPQAASTPVVVDPPETIIVRLASDGSEWSNQSAVKLDGLRASLERALALRAHRVAFFKVTVFSSLKRFPGFWMSCAPPALRLLAS